MTIIEKLYAGVKLDECELKQLADGGTFEHQDDSNRYHWIDTVEYEVKKQTMFVETIFQVGDDIWVIPWEMALKRCWGDKLCNQPYRLEKKTRTITETYYETRKGTEIIK